MKKKICCALILSLFTLLFWTNNASPVQDMLLFSVLKCEHLIATYQISHPEVHVLCFQFLIVSHTRSYSTGPGCFGRSDCAILCWNSAVLLCFAVLKLFPQYWMWKLLEHVQNMKLTAVQKKLHFAVLQQSCMFLWKWPSLAPSSIIRDLTNRISQIDALCWAPVLDIVLFSSVQEQKW